MEEGFLKISRMFFLGLIWNELVRFEDNVHASKFYGANMGPTWGRQDPGGPHVGPMNFAIRGDISVFNGVYLTRLLHSWQHNLCLKART